MTRRASFVVELKLVTDSSGTIETRLFGTEGWTTRPTDTPANTHIPGSVIDPGSIRSELFSGARLTGPVRPSFGQIILNNAKGELDGLMDYGMGGTVTVRYGIVGDAYPGSWITVIVAYAYALIVDFKEVRILLRDRLFLLEKPVVTETFAGVGGLTGTGIATKKQQMVLGRPGLIPLVLFDENKQIYFMQSNGATSRQWVANPSEDYNIFDGGVPLTRGVPYVSEDDGLDNAPAPGEFRLYAQGAQTDAAYESTGPVYVRLGSPPEFDLRAQAVGVFKTNAESRARAWTFVDLLTRAGLSVTVAAGSPTLVAGNRLIDEDQTYLEVMADGAGARFEVFGFNRLDEFFMANLKLGSEGSDASVYTFTAHNAKDFKRQPVPGQESPAWQVSVNAGVAWPSQIATSLTAEDADRFQRAKQQSFTGTADSVRIANLGAESATLEVKGNEFSTLDQRKAFVKRYFELFGARRDLISVTAPLTAETIAIGLHNKVTVNIPRLGCSGGRNFRTVVVDLNLRLRLATFFLWGGTIGPSNAVLGGGTGVANPDDVNPLLVKMGDFITETSGSAVSTGSMEVLMGDFYTITKTDAMACDASLDIEPATVNATLTNGDLTFTHSPVGSTFVCAWVRGSVARRGKAYWEVLNDGSTVRGLIIGLIKQSAWNGVYSRYPANPLSEAPKGLNAVCNGNFFGLTIGPVTNGTMSSNSAYDFVSGDVVGFAVDFDAGKMWVSKNGAWIAGDPATGAGAPWTGLNAASDPYMTFYNSTGDMIGTCHFTPSHFAYTPPKDFGTICSTIDVLDQYFANVILLLHGDGTHGSTAIVDSSSYAKTISITGSSAISTTQSKFSGSSIKGASASYITATLGSDGVFAGDFTIEMWINQSNNDVLFTSAAAGIYLYNNEFFYTGANSPSINLPTVTSGAWAHLAISRTAGVLKTFYNGVEQDSVSYSTSMDFSTIKFGYYQPNGNLHYQDYYDDIRITKNVGRYTADFTPPTAAFPDY